MTSYFVHVTAGDIGTQAWFRIEENTYDKALRSAYSLGIENAESHSRYLKGDGDDLEDEDGECLGLELEVL